MWGVLGAPHFSRSWGESWGWARPRVPHPCCHPAAACPVASLRGTSVLRPCRPRSGGQEVAGWPGPPRPPALHNLKPLPHLRPPGHLRVTPQAQPPARWGPLRLPTNVPALLWGSPRPRAEGRVGRPYRPPVRAPALIPNASSVCRPPVGGRLGRVHPGEWVPRPFTRHRGVGSRRATPQPSLCLSDAAGAQSRSESVGGCGGQPDVSEEPAGQAPQHPLYLHAPPWSVRAPGRDLRLRDQENEAPFLPRVTVTLFVAFVDSLQ